MPVFAYAAVLLVPALAAVGLAVGGAATWLVPALVYGLIPLAELALPGPRRNAPAAVEEARRASPWFDFVIYACVPVQLGLVVALAARAPSLEGWALAGAIVSVGTCCGALGINIGHELGHRVRRRDQVLARVMLSTSLYAHFFVEHNRGHHARVATPEDPASARLGETLPAFWVRSVRDSWLSAWRLEAERLGRRGRSAWSLDNEVLVGAVVQPAIVLGLGLAFGPVGAGAFVAAAVIGALLLETINYVEHYGLSRAPRPDGGWERVTPRHSWTSDRPVSRALLFELPRHADHHAYAGRPYAVLRHFDDAHELPTGYAGMLLLALVPPLFFAVMDRHLARERVRLAPAT